jgi:plasmid stabilization system protein ParE
MTFRVIITDLAEDDAGAIYVWLQQRSPRGAVNWWAAFLRAVDSLRRNAESFGLAPESTDHHEEIREFTFKTRHGHPYRLLFTIRGDIVYALRVRSSGQPLLTSDEIEIPE